MEKVRKLNKQNIDRVIQEYLSSIEDIGKSLSGLRGVDLFHCLKRGEIGSGPYPTVTLFEAANRIMTDLVILKGVKWLIDSPKFPFDEYTVEYGNEDKNDHDITASKAGKTFSGEAFNVAPSFFQSKKSSMLKKLNAQKAKADYKVIIVNSDAVKDDYSPRIKEGLYFVFVDVASGKARLLTEKEEEIADAS